MKSINSSKNKQKKKDIFNQRYSQLPSPQILKIIFLMYICIAFWFISPQVK